MFMFYQIHQYIPLIYMILFRPNPSVYIIKVEKFSDFLNWIIFRAIDNHFTVSQFRIFHLIYQMLTESFALVIYYYRFRVHVFYSASLSVYFFDYFLLSLLFTILIIFETLQKHYYNFFTFEQPNSPNWLQYSVK